MARTARSKIDSKSARLRLVPRAKSYNVTIAPKRMLGYVRVTEGAGRWLAIMEVGRSVTGAAVRRQGFLGLADDVPGAGLSYAEAHRAAATWEPDDAPRNGRMRVRDAVKSYVEAIRADRGDKAAEDARVRLRYHVLAEDDGGGPIPGRPGLADREIATLTLTELRAWRDALVEGRTRATVNRVLANFKAALNHAYADEANGIPSDAAWRRLEAFSETNNRREHHFTESEIARLIREARKLDPDFANLLTASYYTGARYSELAACDVRHVDARRRTLTIPSGKTGARVTTLTEEAARWFAQLAGERPPRDPLLSPAQGERWGASWQHRRMKAALAAAGLPKEASLYALRHSYISRAIERGMPLTLLAENVGTSVKMIEKNYAHMLAASRRALVERTGPRLRVVTSARRATR